MAQGLVMRVLTVDDKVTKRQRQEEIAQYQCTIGRAERVLLGRVLDLCRPSRKFRGQREAS